MLCMVKQPQRGMHAMHGGTLVQWQSFSTDSYTILRRQRCANDMQYSGRAQPPGLRMLQRTKSWPLGGFGACTRTPGAAFWCFSCLQAS